MPKQDDGRGNLAYSDADHIGDNHGDLVPHSTPPLVVRHRCGRHRTSPSLCLQSSRTLIARRSKVPVKKATPIWSPPST